MILNLLYNQILEFLEPLIICESRTNFFFMHNMHTLMIDYGNNYSRQRITRIQLKSQFQLSEIRNYYSHFRYINENMYI